MELENLERASAADGSGLVLHRAISEMGLSLRSP